MSNFIGRTALTFVHPVRRLVSQVLIIIRVEVELRRRSDLRDYVNRTFGQRKGRYIEVGGNDGVTQSPTLLLHQRRQWQGLIIEPFPGYIPKIQQARGSRATVVCAAAGKPLDDPTIELRYSGLMTRSLKDSPGITDSTDQYAERGRQFLPPRVSPFDFLAHCRTVEEILEENNFDRRIDLAVIDVEGAERSVLEGMLGGTFRFENIIVETANLERISDLLSEFKYQQVKKITHHDYHFSLLEGAILS